MKQISLHVYQSIDGCPAPSDKHFDAAVDASSCVLIDEETYLRIYMNHLGWPITAKETLVVTNGGIDLTENERVKFIQGDAVAELRQMKEDGDGMVVAYGEEIGALLLDNGLLIRKIRWHIFRMKSFAMSLWMQLRKTNGMKSYSLRDSQ